MNERAKQLAELGRKVFRQELDRCADSGDTFYYQNAFIDAVAVMLSAPAPRKGKAKEAPVLPFGPGELHQEMKTRVGNIILCEPVEKSLFGRMGKRLQQIDGLERADLPRVLDWIESGGLAWWTYGRPTFESACNNIGKWIAESREWDRRGRPAMKKGQMPADFTPPVDVSGAFK